MGSGRTHGFGVIACMLAAGASEGCKPRSLSLTGGAETWDIGPARQCTWVYSADGLPAFKTALTHPGFDAKFNPTLTVSRAGLTVRVVGTLPDEFVEKHGGMAGVVARFPWLTPISQTAVHDVEPDLFASAPERVRAYEAAKAAYRKAVESRSPLPKVPAWVRKTTVVNLPPNSVMLVYPVAIAMPADGAGKYNTIAGNWTIIGKVRSKSSNELGDFAGFPFLQYSEMGHAFHGPVSASQDSQWRVRRGRVSHGCQRMQGEHILELAVLLGCPGDPKPEGKPAQYCPDPILGSEASGFGKDIEKVTVMEEYDIVPRLDLPQPLEEGEFVGTWDEIFGKFVAVDVEFPFDSPRQFATIFNRAGVFLDATLVRRAPRNNREGERPFVYVHKFPTWDNRDKKLAWGKACR